MLLLCAGLMACAEEPVQKVAPVEGCPTGSGPWTAVSAGMHET